MSHRLRAGLFVPLLLCFAAPAPAQVRAIIRPTLPFRHDAASMAPDRVVLKFREGLAVRLVDGRLQATPPTDLTAVRDALGGARVARLFSRPVAELDAERAALQSRVPPGESPLADLNNYYLVTTSGVAETERLVDALNALPDVETAYAESLPFPAAVAPARGDIPPPTPQFRGLQGHLGAAPAAFGYEQFERVVGARMPDNQLAHLEAAWTLGHEDCDWLSAESYLGAPPNSVFNTPSWIDHGTACVGLMVAFRNGYGTQGFASDCRAFYLVSLSNGGPNQVSLATARLGAGDVMSSSFVYLRPSGDHAPRDFPQADYDAIRIAAAKGIHYTFGAGNTGSDLENQAIFGSRYLPTSASSGGYIIGMTAPGGSSRTADSSYGAAHVIANGWGADITTLGYGDLFDGGGDPRQYYTNTFGGTSAAGPEVAGVIAAYVGIVREQLGVVLDVATVKADLRATGTPITGNVGNRPDLGHLLALRSLPDSLTVANDAAPGGVLQGSVTGNSGEPYALFVAVGRGRTPIGANRPLLLDPTGLLPAGSGTLPTGGAAPFALAVPNNGSLVGLDLFFQAALVRGRVLHLSTSATAAIL